MFNCCNPCICDEPETNSTPVYAFGALLTTGIEVDTAGTNIPVPSNQVISQGIVVDGTNSVFTVLVPGVYRIVYHVNFEQAININSRILLNRVPVDASILHPVAPEQQFNAEVFLTLNKRDTISLQLFGATMQVDFQLGVGATLSITKES